MATDFAISNRQKDFERAIRRKASELRSALSGLGHRISAGDLSQIVVWVIPDALACAHRPLRHDSRFGGSRHDLPAEATAAVTEWVAGVRSAGFRAVISLMHPRELKHYSALRLGAQDLHDFYRTQGLATKHIPWDDPAHRTMFDQRTFDSELGRIREEALRAFDDLPKPVLLHCSAGIDRSSPVAAFIWAHRFGGALDAQSRSALAPGIPPP